MLIEGEVEVLLLVTWYLDRVIIGFLPKELTLSPCIKRRFAKGSVESVSNKLNLPIHLYQQILKII